ncbi:MAG: hypothetical protein ACXWCT_14700 [Flavitalea sp.]
MEHLLFAAYLVLFAWLVTKVKFFTASGLSNSQLVILFLLKVMAGIFYGWMGVYYGEMAKMIDTWAYHIESLQEYALLKNDPVEFATNLFQNNYEGGYTHFFATKNSWWNDVKANLLIKIMAVFNLLSFGQYYTNVIFYSFISLTGPIAIYRVMKDVYRQHIPVLLACFFIPSFLYWTSGLHKEGLIFMGIAIMIYHFYFGFRDKFSLKRILWIVSGFLLVLILRNFLVITLIPPLIAWILAFKIRRKPVFTFVAAGLISVILFFTARYFHAGLDFPQATVTKQQEFFRLEGGSTVNVKSLEPTAASFLQNAPQALGLSILRPYPSDVRHLLSLAASLEINFILLFFIIFLVWRHKNLKPIPLILFLLFFSLAVLMMIGYTVNNLGAIVRYRSIVLPLLVIPMVANTDWPRIEKLIFNNIRN